MQNVPLIVGQVALPLMRLFREEICQKLALYDDDDRHTANWPDERVNFQQWEYRLRPDILLSPGYDHFFDRRFRTHFFNTGIYGAFNYSDEKYNLRWGSDPYGALNFFAGTPYVMVVSLKRLKSYAIPHRWNDLLSDDYFGEIITPGTGNNISSIMLLHYYATYDLNAMRQFVGNVSACAHGSWIVRKTNEGRPPAAVSIIPWIFANCIMQNEDLKVIWPEEGAITSPMWMTVNTDVSQKSSEIAIGICKGRFAETCSELFFPWADLSIKAKIPEGAKFLWPGWDFISNTDITVLLAGLSSMLKHEYVS